MLLWGEAPICLRSTYNSGRVLGMRSKLPLHPTLKNRYSSENLGSRIPWPGTMLCAQPSVKGTTFPEGGPGGAEPDNHHNRIEAEGKGQGRFFKKVIEKKYERKANKKQKMWRSDKWCFLVSLTFISFNNI